MACICKATRKVAHRFVALLSRVQRAQGKFPARVSALSPLGGVAGRVCKVLKTFVHDEFQKVGRLSRKYSVESYYALSPESSPYVVSCTTWLWLHGRPDICIVKGIVHI
jgi:hypothetical protein